mmetsp:Transcript_2656/g.315  ORF Transcript_2656/g.315 Transcript_2656/m.315 type:complete len:114 (+) Transcript_2656:228-569(+)
MGMAEYHNLAYDVTLYGLIRDLRIPNELVRQYGDNFTLSSLFTNAFVDEARAYYLSVVSIPDLECLREVADNTKCFIMCFDTFDENWVSRLQEAWILIYENYLYNTVILLKAN